MIDLQKIAFLPLDIDLGIINFDALEAYHNEYSERPRTNMGNNTHGVYVFGVSPVLYRGTEEQFYDQQHNDTNFINRYNTTLGHPKFTFGFDKKFPQLANVISNLPITLTHVEMLSNKKDAPPHFDDWEVDGVVDPAWAILTTRTEAQKQQIPDWDVPLNSYKIFIYEHDLPSFFMCKDLLSNLVYGKAEKLSYAAAISKLSYPHGATYQPGLRKYVLSVWGIVDREKHLALLERSYAKNSQYAISFK